VSVDKISDDIHKFLVDAAESVNPRVLACSCTKNQDQVEQYWSGFFSSVKPILGMETASNQQYKLVLRGNFFYDDSRQRSHASRLAF
jgi:hypothetical protein